MGKRSLFNVQLPIVIVGGAFGAAIFNKKNTRSATFDDKRQSNIEQ
jgi:hypothetical protein